MPVRLCNYTDVYYRRFITPNIEFMKASALPREVKKFELQRGDVLITKDSESWIDIAVPAYVTTDLPGVLCGYHLAQIRPYLETLSGEYLLRAFQAEPIAYQFRVAANGVTRFALSGTDIAAGLFPIPPKAEQDIITAFLAHADRLISRLIRSKWRLIELLNEQKQAIIHQAVTRGLDPNVRLKPSGIDWLGDVPAHWDVGALRRFWEVIDCKHLTVPFVEDGIPLASVVEVQPFDLDLSRCKRTTEEWYQHLVSGGRKPKRGDLIYCRNTSVGACAYVNTDIDFAMGQDVCLITSRIQNQRYLNYLLHSWFMAEQLERLLVGSTFKRINISNIRALIVLVPPKSEQDTICHALDDGVAEIVRTTQRVNREINLLREYRTRLITDVVTGKLDVRGMELTALDEVDTLDDLDIDKDIEAEEMDDIEEVVRQ